MNAIQLKICKTSHKISIALKIGCILTLIAATLALVGISILAFSKSSLKESFLAAFEVTAKDGTSLNIVPENLFILLVSMLVYSLFLCFILFVIQRIFHDISLDGTPFHSKHPIRMKRIAVLILLFSLAGSYFDSLFDMYTLGELSWHLNFEGIFLGIIVFCLAQIFEYGCDLQRLSDETL